MRVQREQYDTVEGTTPNRERRKHREGVTRGVIGESQPSNHKLEMESGIDVVTKESVQSACHLRPGSPVVVVAIVTINFP